MPGDQGPPERAAIDTALAEWRQGDFALDVPGFVYLADLAMPLTEPAQQAAAEAQNQLGVTAVASEVSGFVAVSQTCDIVRPCAVRPLIELAVVVEVDPGTFGHVRRARTPRFAFIPALEARRFVADLDQIVTAEKSVVAQWQRESGCQTEEERLDFSLALARKRARFAFPDNFVECVGPFEQRLRAQHGTDSLEGQMLAALREIRIRAEPSWLADQITLLFLFIRHSDGGLDDGIWEQQASDWCALLQLQGPYADVLPLVAELGDLPASDYVASHPLDLGHLSDNPALRQG